MLLISQKAVMMQPELKFIVISQFVDYCGAIGANISGILAWNLVNIRFGSIDMQKNTIELFKKS